MGDEKGLDFFCVVSRDRIRTSGWKLQRQICTHFKRELSKGAVRMEWAVSESSSMSQTLAVLAEGERPLSGIVVLVDGN